jgi:hypothetical protein
VIPADNSRLNYSTVYFEESFFEKAFTYELRLFKDSLVKGSQPFRTAVSQVPAFSLHDLPWGTDYFWRLVYYDSLKNEVGRSNMHNFSIQKLVLSHLDEVRLAVRLNKESANAGGVICVDYSRSVFNRMGEALWTIPAEDSAMGINVQIRDLRITDDNTVTFLTGKAPLEIDLEGHVLWKAPFPFVFNGDTIQYHHDFQKTKRGTYMVLGLRKVWRPVLQKYDTSLFRQSDARIKNGTVYLGTQLSQLFEFDKKGRLIWFWDSNDYITDEDLNYKKTNTGIPNFATHANAFGENADGSKVYVGFRDLSRIVKIDKKTKRAERSWGEKYPGSNQEAGDLFRKQHGSTITSHGSILILNNNSYVKDGGVSSVMELRDDSVKGKEPLLWKFDLNFDSLTKGKSVSGGNVVELPNGNLLVCAGTLNRIFEVTRNKEIVWDAFVELKRKGEQRWEASPQYRANWIAALRYDHFVVKKTSPQKLLIYNTGSHTDTYDFEVNLNNGRKMPISKPVKLEAGASAEVILQQVAVRNQKGTVTVTSRNSGKRKVIEIK